MVMIKYRLLDEAPEAKGHKKSGKLDEQIINNEVKTGSKH